MEDKNTGALVARRAKAKASADLMSTILHQSADAAFNCAAQVMYKNKIVIPASEVEDDMYERAARVQVKTFSERSAHAPFLPGMREHGRVGTVVHGKDGEEIDTRVFGSSRARHRERNNKLKCTAVIDGELKPPSLFPFGTKESAADKRKRGGISYLAAGESVSAAGSSLGAAASIGNITPQRTPSTGGWLLSVATASTAINLSCGSNEDDIDSMMNRVKRRAFVETGVVQEVIDVDTGKTSTIIDRKSERRRRVYRNLNQFSEMARDIVGNTMKSRRETTSLEALDVVDKFLGE